MKYEHFTQNENDEKINHDGIIGKFGIGLKDALATFERKGIEIKIFSKYGDFTLGKTQKNGFDDLITLHAYISDPSNSTLIGTEYVLSNISDFDIQQAKRLFLKFTNERVIEKTKYGDVLQKTNNHGNIYINGVLVAVEENFLFSYNLTVLNATIKKAINRERTNVGRTAYANSVKQILLECLSEEIGNKLSEDLSKYSYGNSHDELKWIDIQQHAANILNSYKKVVFVTADEIERGADLIDEARQGGSKIVVIPTTLRDKIAENNTKSDESEKVRIFSEFVFERNENFELKFVSELELTAAERNIFNYKDRILSAIGGKPWNVKNILISETMQKDDFTFQPTEGLWSHSEDGVGEIIIKRSVLNDGQRYVAVLLHELSHAISGASDATRRFESELTRQLGIFGYKFLKSYNEEQKSNLFTSPHAYSVAATINETTERIRVKSSNLYSVGYNQQTRKLQIEYIKGDVYEYEDVPQNVYEAFMSADSKGQFAKTFIYSRYKYKVIN